MTGGARIPLLQDAFIDNTVEKTQIVHKVVEVKVWDDYKYKKNQKIIELDSENEQDRKDDLMINDRDHSLIHQDVKYVKQILSEMMTKVQNLEGGTVGLENWLK